MTDKIIIDGVDVSGCEFYNHTYCHLGTGNLTQYKDKNGNCTFCEIFKNCYYKQLQRKERESEGLRHGQHVQNKVIKDLQEQLQAEKEKVGELEIKLEFFPIVEARKNEEKETRKHFENLAKKYKQALDEIKEIAKVYYVCEELEQILQKCEVLDD